MKPTKKAKEISLVALVALSMILFNEKFNGIDTQESIAYLDFASDFLGEDMATTKIYANATRQQFINMWLSMMMIPIFYFGVLKKLEQKSTWWFAFPIAIVGALVYAWGLSHVDRWLNPYYFVSFHLNFPNLTGSEGFTRLLGDNFIKVLNACFIAGLAFQIQQLLVTDFKKTKRKLRPVGSLYWLSLFIITFAVSTLITHWGQGMSFNLFMLSMPSILLLSIISLGIGAIFLEHFFNQGQIRFRREYNLGFKFAFCSMGFFAALTQRTLWKYWLTYDFEITYAGMLTIFLYIILVICLLCYGLYRLNVGNIRSSAGLQAQLEQKISELNLLRAQISPHFLFNSLNTVYGIALTEDSPKTASGVQRLSEMMRFMLKENKQEYIPLSREIDYINNYIELQKLRLMGSDLELYVHLDEASQGNIAPMMLVPFVENAFKHGVSMSHDSFIEINLDCREDELELYVKNTKHERSVPKNEESGIGLNNVKERLEILYKNKYTLDINQKDDSFEVRLILDLI